MQPFFFATPGEFRLWLERHHQSESELVRRGLRMACAELGRTPSALDLAGRSVGKFAGGPTDLSTHRRHLDDFGR